MILTDRVIWRKAGVNEDPVNCKMVHKPAFLSQAGVDLYVKFKAGDLTEPPDFQDKVKREAEWIDSILARERHQREQKAAADAGRQPLFPRPAPVVVVPPAAAVPVKRELVSPERKVSVTPPLKASFSLTTMFM